MVFDGLKPLSQRIIAYAAAIFFLVVGTSLIYKTNIIDYLRIGIMIVVALILGIEVMWKKYTLKNKKYGLMQFLSFFMICILIITSVFLIPGIPYIAPSYLITMSDWLVGIGALFIAVEATL